ncbi:MAG: hypothetical protein LBN21_10415, partial [Treponema sp.]|nr:hypothetical protein [Treponema sp.]
GIENLTIKAKPSITIAASIDGKPANKYEIHGSVSGTLSGDVSADFAQESGNITLKPSYTVKATVKGSQGGYTVDGAVNAIVSANISSAFEDDVPDGTLSGGVDARLSVSDGAHGLKLFAQAKLPKTVAELIEDGIEAEYAVYDNDNTKLFEDTFDLSDLFGDDEGDEPEYGGGGY